MFIYSTINYLFNNIFFNFSYDCLYVFSYIQIKFTNFYKQIQNYQNQQNEYDFELFDTINGTIKNVNLNILKNNNFIENYIIIKNNKLNLTKFINKKIFNVDLSKLEWKKTKYTFISAIFCNDSKILKILNTNADNCNYYVVDNVIDYNFIKYYMIKYYNINIQNIKDFNISIMNNNMKIIILNFNENPYAKILLNEKSCDLIDY